MNEKITLQEFEDILSRNSSAICQIDSSDKGSYVERRNELNNSSGFYGKPSWQKREEAEAMLLSSLRKNDGHINSLENLVDAVNLFSKYLDVPKEELYNYVSSVSTGDRKINHGLAQSILAKRGIITIFEGQLAGAGLDFNSVPGNVSYHKELVFSGWRAGLGSIFEADSLSRASYKLTFLGDGAGEGASFFGTSVNINLFKGDRAGKNTLFDGHMTGDNCMFIGNSAGEGVRFSAGYGGGRFTTFSGDGAGSKAIFESGVYAGGSAVFEGQNAGSGVRFSGTNAGSYVSFTGYEAGNDVVFEGEGAANFVRLSGDRAGLGIIINGEKAKRSRKDSFGDRKLISPTKRVEVNTF